MPVEVAHWSFQVRCCVFLTLALLQLSASSYFIATLSFLATGELQDPTGSEGRHGTPVGVGSHHGRQIQEEGNA